MAAQNSPRTAAQKAKARREVKEDMSWDTNVRTTAYRAGFQDPHAPGFKASNGIDPRTGQQEAPTAVLAKKQERWDGDKGYISTIPGPLASETVSVPLRTQDLRDYVPPPAIPGCREDIYNGDYKAAMRENPGWRMAGRCAAVGHHGYKS